MRAEDRGSARGGAPIARRARWALPALGCAAIALAGGAVAERPGEIRLETDALALAIGPDARALRLTERAGGRELLARPGAEPVARIFTGGEWRYARGWTYSNTVPPEYVGGRCHDATGAERIGDRLVLRFAGSGHVVTCRIAATPAYCAVELLGVEGPPLHHIDLMRLAVVRLGAPGHWLCAVGDESFAVCLCAGSARADATASDASPGEVHLRVGAEPAAGLEGARAVLFGCARPREGFLDAMGRVEAGLGLPAGARARRAPEQGLSYLWAEDLTPGNVGTFIRHARRGGFGMLLFSYTAFSAGAGHFLWKRSYPGGMSDLARVTGAIRAAGLQVGLHIHYSKAHKRDPYVTPVPDDRLGRVREFTLAAPVDPGATVVPVEEDPAGCTLDEGRRILMIGKELVAYAACSGDPPRGFAGCERGHLGTRAAAHARGDRVRLLDVDTWPIFIRYDQDTDIQDETAARIAEIVARTGPYAMVYFDGAEDVSAPFWYNVGRAQHRVWRRLEPAPTVCEAPRYTSFSWHMITRGNAYDKIPDAAGMKDFCDLVPCVSAAARARDHTRIEFGWLGNFGDGRGGRAGPDAYEYVASRAAAWDCPLSLAARAADLETHPRGGDCLDAIRAWESARTGRRLPPGALARLRAPVSGEAKYVSCYDAFRLWEDYRDRGILDARSRAILAARREVHLIEDPGGGCEPVEIEPVAGLPAPCRGYTFRRAGAPGDARALLWAERGEAILRLPPTAARPRVTRPGGGEMALAADGDGIRVGDRCYLEWRGIDIPAARDILGKAVAAGAD